MTQTTELLRILESGRSITPIEALNELGCFRLGGRIYDLKQAGHRIEATMVTVPNGKRVASYRLLRAHEQLSLIEVNEDAPAVAR